jgi:hypothetical protein
MWGNLWFFIKFVMQTIKRQSWQMLILDPIREKR